VHLKEYFHNRQKRAQNVFAQKAKPFQKENKKIREKKSKNNIIFHFGITNSRVLKEWNVSLFQSKIHFLSKD